MKYYHNPRCTKSRQGLEYLNEKGVEPEVVLYMKEALTKEEVKDVLKALGISAMELMRKKEQDFKDQIQGKDLSEDELIAKMIAFPKLMERPIFLNKGKAAIGRPAENFNQVIS